MINKPHNPPIPVSGIYSPTSQNNPLDVEWVVGENISVKLPPALREALKKLAEEEGCTESKVIRDALEPILKRRGVLDELYGG